jgi:hypothetical protein
MKYSCCIRMLDSLLGNIAGADIAAFNHTSLVSTISAGPEDITHEQYMHHINIGSHYYEITLTHIQLNYEHTDKLS